MSSVLLVLIKYKQKILWNFVCGNNFLEKWLNGHNLKKSLAKKNSMFFNIKLLFFALGWR